MKLTKHPSAAEASAQAAAPITDYLKQEISALDLANLLDGHLHDTVQLIARSGEAWTEDQMSAYHHIRRLRDLFVELSQAKPLAQ